jgi:hypothetical protein
MERRWFPRLQSNTDAERRRSMLQWRHIEQLLYESDLHALQILIDDRQISDHDRCPTRSIYCVKSYYSKILTVHILIKIKEMERFACTSRP